MKKLICLILAGAMALTILTGCGTTEAPIASQPDTSNTPSPKTPVDTSLAVPGADWSPPVIARLIDFSGLEIGAEIEALLGEPVLPILETLAVPLYLAAEYGETGMAFDGGLSGDADISFAWSLIAHVLMDYAEDSEIERGAKITVPEELIGRYFAAYIYGGDEIPPIPDSLSGVVTYDEAASVYRFEPLGGVSPTVTAISLYAEENDNGTLTLGLTVDVEYEGEPSLPVFLQLTYTGHESTRYGLSEVMIAAAGENQGEDGVLPHINEVYNYGGNIPDMFDLTEESEEGAVFLAGDGARIEVLGDWADVGGYDAITNAYNASCELPGYVALGSFFEQELGFGVFHISADTADYPEGQAAYILGAQNGRSIVLVTLTYPPELHYAYLPIAIRLTEELTTLVIPDNVMAAADEGIIAAS